MSQFPSPADSASSSFKTSPKNSSKLYPDLAMTDPEDGDILAELGIPPPSSSKSKRPGPARPPPPRSQSLPNRSAPPDYDAASDTVNYSLPPSSSSSSSSRSKSASKEDSNFAVPSPLHPHEVRWFYMEPGKYWQSFNGQDSLALEECYRRRYAVPGGEGSTAGHEVIVLGDMHAANLEDMTCQPIYWTADKGPWSLLRGCWFEVNGEKWYPLVAAEYDVIETEHCQKKWREKARKDAELQLWATANNSTTSEVNSNSPSVIKRRQTTGSIKKPSPPQEPTSPLDPGSVIVNKLSLPKYDVHWMSNGDIIKMKREITSQLLNKVGEKFGKGTTNFGSSKLVRGYKEPASREDKIPPIGHVVFVIHGIGQNMDISCITTSTNDLRDTTVRVAKKCFKDEWEEKRVEFIPVEWRTWLSLDKGLIGDITLHGVPMLRRMLNDSILDVMYYLSPKFKPEIMDGLRFQLHKQYNEFMKHHPHFLTNGGTVSIIGHSLGSVITYDLLLHTAECLGVDITSGDSPLGGSPTLPQHVIPSREHKSVELAERRGGSNAVRFDPNVVSPESSVQMEGEPMDMGEDEPDTASGFDRQSAAEELEQLKRKVAELEQKLGMKKERKGLKFKVDHFFAVGSPLGVFLAMREHETLVRKSYKGAASILPACVCKRIHNLHHPSDPVAYRLEPLVNARYTNIKPVKVDSAGSKPSKDMVDLASGPRNQEQLQQPTKGWFDTFSQWVSSKKPTQLTNSTDNGKPKPEKVVDSDDKLQPEEKLRERLDFMLRESFTESSYMNSITAHTGYWTSSECAQFILLQIYKYRQGGCS